MRKLFIRCNYILLSLIYLNVYAVEVINIKTFCKDGTETALCRCGDGFIQTNLGEQCDLGTAKNGVDIGNDGKFDYGCDKDCKLFNNDPTVEWSCNAVTPDYSSRAKLAPEKSEFNKLYLKMLALYKSINAVTINCLTATSIADINTCTDKHRNAEQFTSMNRHTPFLCDSINTVDKISPAFPTLKYIDMITKTEKTITLNYETKCGLGNLLLEKTNFKWVHNGNPAPDFEALFNCKMYFLKTVSGYYVRHALWQMYFDDPTGDNNTTPVGEPTIKEAFAKIPDQATFNAFAQIPWNVGNGKLATALTGILYCIKKIEPTDPKAAECEDANLCYAAIAKGASPSGDIQLRVFNADFDFSKNTSNATGVTKFPGAIPYYIGPAPASPPALPNIVGNKAGSAGYFTIYPQGSTFPWFREL